MASKAGGTADAGKTVGETRKEAAQADPQRNSPEARRGDGDGPESGSGGKAGAKTPLHIHFGADDSQVASVLHDPGLPLAELRLRLKGVLERSDRFLVDGAAVLPSSERDIAMSNACDDKGVLRVRRIKLKDIEAPALPDRTERLKIDSPARLEERIRPVERKSEESSKWDTYATLSNEARGHLIEISGALRGILLKGDTVTWSHREVLDRGDSPAALFTARVPQQSYSSSQVMTFEARERDVRSTIGGSAAASLSTVWVAAEAEVSRQEAQETKTVNTVAYTYTELLVPKLELLLGRERPIVRECLDALNSFAGCDGRFFPDFIRLRELFTQWGAYLPLETVLGGKLFLTDEKRVKTRQEAERFAMEARAALKIRGGVGLRASGETSSGKGSIDQDESLSALLHAVGGDPGLVGATEKWSASLGNWLSWRPCRVEQLVPLYSFATEEAQRGIFLTLWFWQNLWRSDPMMLDFDHYLFPLTRHLAMVALPEPPRPDPSGRMKSLERSVERRAAVRRPAVATYSGGAYVVADRAGELHLFSLDEAGERYLLGKPLSSPWNDPPAKPMLGSDVSARGSARLWVRSSPVAACANDGSWLIVLVATGADRTLTGLLCETDGGRPGNLRVTPLGDLGIRDVIGDPVKLGGTPGGRIAARVAVRTEAGIHVLDVKEKGVARFAVPCKVESSFSGSFGGFTDSANKQIVNLLLPSSPMENRFSSGGDWGARSLPRCHPAGAIAAIDTRTDRQEFHIFAPSGGGVTYFHGLDQWWSQAIATTMTAPVMTAVEDRLVVLGRAGQQLQSFSVDLLTERKSGDKDPPAVAGEKRVRVNPVRRPFANGVTGDPVLFRATAPDGDLHLSAVVPFETDKLLHLWYDHAKDEWSLLPP